LLLVSKKFTALLFIVLTICLACSKQESSSIQDGEIRNQQEIDRLEACSAVNFTRGVLLHQNVILLFKCTKWDLEFPSLNQSIKKVPSLSWDHFMAPIDKEFVENLTRRERVFSNIRELDAKNGLDDLSRVLVALNETNFFDALNALLSCAENPGLEICVGRDKIPTKSSLMNIIRIVDSNPKEILKGSNLIKFLTSSISGNEEKLRAEISKFITSPVFIDLRLRLFDAIAEKARMGLQDEDRVFLSKVLLTGSSDQALPWIYKWLNDSQMTREKFKALLEFPVLGNPNLVQEYKGLKLAYDDNFNCTVRSGNLNDLLAFDFKSHLKDHVSILTNRDYKGYYDYVSSLLVGLKTSVELCNELDQNKYGFSFVKMMANQASFLGERKYYDLFKFILSNSTVKGDQDNSFAENLYFFDLVAGNVFSNTNLVNDIVIKKTRELYPLTYDILKKVPVDAYLDLGELSRAILSKSNDSRFKGVSDFWNFFTPVEKNFVFNFVDRHFEGDTQYSLLFDFYSKFLDDFAEVQPVFKEKWSSSESTEEMSYIALQDLFKNLAGKETLKDFKKFFGRDQILKVLEVISNGNNLKLRAKEELDYRKTDLYIARMRTDKYQFEVTYNPKDAGIYNAQELIDCMKVYSDIENGFYVLVRKLPSVCSKVSNENIAFRVFGWLNQIEDSYKTFKPASNSADSLLSDKGLLSPYMLNSLIGTSKILDSILGDIDSVLPTKNGIRYIGLASRYHLIEQNALSLLDKNFKIINQWMTVVPQKNVLHRNAMLKEFTRESNFKYTNEVMSNLSSLLSQYGDWIKTGGWDRATNRNLGNYDPSQECEKVINKFVAPFPCPSKEIVKRHTNNILKYLTASWEPGVPSAISQLLTSVKPGEGINIPLGTNKTQKYRLTLKETMKYLYDTSDKTLKSNVNRQSTYYVNDSNYYSNEILTTLERVEVVIRDVRFGNNYLGTAFLNAITHSDDYNGEASARKKLMSQCIKIPVVRCARAMSDNDLRMANNALVAFDSLLDVNNGRGLDPKLNYGNFLKTFEQTLVASSAKAAQEVQLLPLSDDLLLKHNGRLLSDMTMMTMWSNTARVIRDRVGRTREEFDKFIESEAFNRVDKSLLLGFDLNYAAPSAEKLLKKLQTIPAGEKQNVLDSTIDWVSTLNYNQTRLVEDTVAKLLVVGSYLGSPEVVFGKPVAGNNRFIRYRENNLYQLFLALEKIIDYYPTLKNYMPDDMKIIDAFKPLNNALVFLTDSLATTKDPEKNTAYLVLNDVFNVLQVFMFNELPDPSIINIKAKLAPAGLELLLGFMNNPKNVNQSYSLLRDNYRYLDFLHQNKGSWFKAVSTNLKRIVESNRVDLTPFRDYLAFTSKNASCSARQSCIENYQFDELASLLKYLGESTKSGETRLAVAVKTILVENFDQLQSMIDDLLPSLKIKEVRVPLR